MNRINYAGKMDEIIAGLHGEKPRLLLHACCAPCSSAVLEKLRDYFQITILYYNPNIYPPEEYHRRENELENFLKNAGYMGIELVELPYDPDEFYHAVAGLEQEMEGGKRCTVCYELRMRQAAKYAAEHGFDFFTTTLSISPMKDPVRINQIGENLQQEYGVRHLTSEFRKRDGFKRSLEISREYGLYRQDYCGCIFSKEQRERKNSQQKSASDNFSAHSEKKC